MNNLLTENFDNKNTDFGFLKKNSFLANPTLLKKAAIRNAKGSSFLEGIDLPETFFLTSFELADRMSV